MDGEKNAGTRPETPKASGNPIKAIWDFFSSIKLTVILIIIIAAVSIIGTIVDQTDPMKNMGMLVSLFGPSSAQGALNLLVRLGITNMYHSWWFVFLLLMLSANIAICTIERLPRVIQMVRKKQEPLTDQTLKNMALRKEIKLTGDIPEGAEKARAAIKAMGYSPREYKSDGEVQYFAEKGKFSRLGVYVTHISILIIFAGALIGSFWGFKGFVQITEGGTIDRVALTNKPLLRNVGPELPIPFQVRCDKFTLKLYEGSQMPSDYLSTLTVVDGGKDVLTKTIRVNDPLEYGDLRFFQSSYGVVPNMATMTIRAIPTGPGMSVRDYNLKRGEKVKIEGSDISMALVDMAPDVVIGPGKKLIAQSDQFNGRGVAMLVFIGPDGRVIEQAVILNQDPESQPKRVPFNFSIMGYKGPYYTGLQVGYDPGVWVVWLGCTVMVLGILVAFFMYHKRVWVRVLTGEKGAVTLVAAGSSNKNRGAFEAEFGRLIEKLEAK